MSSVDDVRDKRDPADIGRIMLGRRGTGLFDHLTASEMYDREADVYAIAKEFDPGESTVVFTQRAYQQELKTRAAQGDKFAISMLTTGKPGDSDE